MNIPRIELGESFLYHAKNARNVWERSTNGKWYAREVTPADIKRWEEIGNSYIEGTYVVEAKKESAIG